MRSRNTNAATRPDRDLIEAGLNLTAGRGRYGCCMNRALFATGRRAARFGCCGGDCRLCGGAVDDDRARRMASIARLCPMRHGLPISSLMIWWRSAPPVSIASAPAASSTWAEAVVVSATILRCVDAQRPKTGSGGKLAGNRKFPKPAPVRVKLTMPVQTCMACRTAAISSVRPHEKADARRPQP